MPALTKIGVYYDGNFFQHSSDYYRYHHPRKAWLGFRGLHDFIRRRIAQEERTEERYVQVIDAHYFRGRRSAQDASLYYERQLDFILMHAGIATHYLPLTRRNGVPMEKGIDVWLALEAFESAILKRYDVLVLIAGDSDYVPLVRKTAVAGTRVMVVGFNFSYESEGRTFKTQTSQKLLEVSSYPVILSDLIEKQDESESAALDGLFTAPRLTMPLPAEAPTIISAVEEGGVESEDDSGSAEEQSAKLAGQIKALKEGYGFIIPEDRSGDVFFFHRELVNREFIDLIEGQRVTYQLGKNADGRSVAVKVEVLE